MYEQGMKFFLTGSNSNLLSTELSSLLTGRHIDFELYPFSFREFLKTMDYEYNENDILNTQRKARLNKLFSEYLVSGGYPEYLLYRDTQILQELFRDVITKDIVLRHNVREARALRELAGYLVSNVTSFVSYNKLRKQYSLGSTHTLKNYLEYFTEVYMFFELPMFSYSVNRQIQNNRKIYAIDNGIVKANGFAFSENAGKQLENMVFIELKRRGKEIFYHKGKYECDFLLKEGDRVIQAIQVTLHMDEDNRARELRGLKEAMETYDLKQGTILTLDQKDSFKQGKKTIKAVPVYEWILSGN
jgi:predicted AAA+ superfamily ATPase